MQYKVKRLLPINYYTITKSYLGGGYFSSTTKHQYTVTVYPSGVPHGGDMGQAEYLLYTVDIPTSVGVTTATFADVATILASRSNPVISFELLLQTNLYQAQTMKN